MYHAIVVVHNYLEGSVYERSRARYKRCGAPAVDDVLDDERDCDEDRGGASDPPDDQGGAGPSPQQAAAPGRAMRR
jgi:hypothetical protein